MNSVPPDIVSTDYNSSTLDDALAVLADLKSPPDLKTLTAPAPTIRPVAPPGTLLNTSLSRAITLGSHSCVIG